MQSYPKNNSSFKKMFEPTIIGNIKLSNRLIMAPMGTRLSSESGAVTDIQIAYYEERAKGGVGAIISESTAVDSPLGLTGATSMRLHDNAYIGGHNELVERVKAHGSKIFSQLVHAGRQTKPASIQGMQPVAPSPIPCGFLKVVPRELKIEEIEEIIVKFGLAAERAKRAGYDGVEIHGAHGYLIDQFMSEDTNQRQDKYGGSFESRMNFPLEIVSAIRKQVGNGFPILFRLNAVNRVGSDEQLNETMQRARLLESAGVDALDVSAGTYETFSTIIEPMSYDEAWKISMVEKVKKAVNIPVIGVGVIRTPATAESILRDGRCDLVSLGRALIADPYWPTKAKEGRENEINRCLSCNIGCMGGRILKDLRVRCSVNPVAGKEYMQGSLKKPATKKKVIVVGGGPAGMMAAVTAAHRGHGVKLYEKSDTLGGQLIAAASSPYTKKISWFIEYLIGRLKVSNVEVNLNVAPTVDQIIVEQPDAVVLATGAQQKLPEIPGIHSPSVLKAWDVLVGNSEVAGANVLVAGGGSVGVETALKLAQQVERVILVEMTDNIAADMEPINRGDLLAKLAQHDIQVMTETLLKSIAPGEVILYDKKGDSESRWPADSVVIALGSEANNGMAIDLINKIEEIYEIGDCHSPRKIIDAVSEGYTVGNIL